MASIYYKDNLCTSAGTVYMREIGPWVASTEGGIVKKFNDEIPITGEGKKKIEAFVKEAEEATENTYAWED